MLHSIKSRSTLGVICEVEMGKEVFELLAREPQGPTTSGGKDCADVRGDLALEGVVFSYPSRPTVLMEVV